MVIPSRKYCLLILFTLLCIQVSSILAAAPFAVDDAVTTTQNIPLLIDVLKNDIPNASTELESKSIKPVRPIRRGIFAQRDGQIKYLGGFNSEVQS